MNRNLRLALSVNMLVVLAAADLFLISAGVLFPKCAFRFPGGNSSPGWSS
ncbi:MAG: hypothetical protein WCF84_22945 [Anaerolineae bacterium]